MWSWREEHEGALDGFGDEAASHMLVLHVEIRHALPGRRLGLCRQLTVGEFPVDERVQISDLLPALGLLRAHSDDARIVLVIGPHHVFVLPSWERHCLQVFAMELCMQCFVLRLQCVGEI